MIANVLSIAGSDPSGGAGIQADIKTFAALHCHGLSAITALTVQNTQAVFDIHVLPAAFVAAEIDRLFADSQIAAVKIGMLAAPEIAAAVADVLARHRPRFIVLDPVRAASSGASLASGDLAAALRTRLAPMVDLVTPNLDEAAWLCASSAPADRQGMDILARALNSQGFRAVLLKGGHLGSTTSDDLFFDGTATRVFAGKRIATSNTHGTGCTLSAAIAAYVAQGMTLIDAIAAAKLYVTQALATADQLSVGRGPGPLNHFHAVW